MHFLGKSQDVLHLRLKSLQPQVNPRPLSLTSEATALSDDVFQVFSILLQPLTRTLEGICEEIWYNITHSNNNEKLEAF